MIEGLKDIFVGLTKDDDSAAEAPALAYGLSLAAAASAAVCVESASLRVELHSTWVNRFAAGLVDGENKRRRSLAQAVAARASTEAHEAGLVCTTYTPHLNYAQLLDSFSQSARLHDLSVYSADAESLSHNRGVIDALLTRTGRPIIVVPQTVDTFRCGRLLVAWEGSVQAARAVNDALPLLRAAEAVEIVSVLGEKQIADCGMGARLAPHLARHGIEATVNCLGVDGDVARTLRSAAAAFRADMMVLGGYVHSHSRQLLFGGVTQSLLKESDWPLFMSH